MLQPAKPGVKPLHASIQGESGSDIGFRQLVVAEIVGPAGVVGESNYSARTENALS